MQATALALLGEAHRRRGDAAEAGKAFAQAFALADAIGARVPAVKAQRGLARLDETMDAEALLTQARGVQAPALHWPALLFAGTRKEAAGDLPAAVALYREAVEVIARLRQGLRDEAAGDTYLEQREAWEPYLRLAQALRALGQADAAAQAIEAAEWPPLSAEQEARI